ncbi:hypothetical protein D1007_60888 [Hordeum vulgare]|nr:hypothetical protein D1007_60888 [Hordeum vulgare]
MKELAASIGLRAPDQVTAFISRRVLPLHGRPHWMCDMSGRKDPWWLSSVELPPHKVATQVDNITNFQLDEEESLWPETIPLRQPGTATADIPADHVEELRKSLADVRCKWGEVTGECD